MLVIGITGRNCAGKDTFADLLEARGFERYSLSDALREELRARGAPITRPALIELGRELREAEGPAVLAERMKKMLRTDRVTLVSVRSPAEVASLRELAGFVLVSVDAPAAERFRREVSRSREQAVQTLAEFEELERREESTDPNAQQLGATIALADHVLANGGSQAALEERAVRLLADLDGARRTDP
jgi:dephospho-CoA kinase